MLGIIGGIGALMHLRCVPRCNYNNKSIALSIDIVDK